VEELRAQVIKDMTNTVIWMIVALAVAAGLYYGLA
jgi:hypothetical protein